jgi:hypothetical protein
VLCHWAARHVPASLRENLLGKRRQRLTEVAKPKALGRTKITETPKLHHSLILLQFLRHDLRPYFSGSMGRFFS